MPPLQDLRVISAQRLIAPAVLKGKLPTDDRAAQTVLAGRAAVENILTRRDNRLLAIVGPCSIHDPEGALDYARRLLALREELSDRVEIVMRVYFEKPRTTLGWKGLVNDPHLDDSCDIEAGSDTRAPALARNREHGHPGGDGIPRFHRAAVPR